MRCASKKALKSLFPNLDDEKINLVRRIAKARDDAEELERLIREHCPKTTRHANQCFGDPFDTHLWRTTMALEAIDELIGGFGIEPLGPYITKTREGPPYEYVNQGDPYIPTLIYNRAKDNLFASKSGWGWIAEQHPDW